METVIDEAILQALDEMKQSGELTPELADQILQYLQGTGGGHKAALNQSSEKNGNWWINHDEDRITVYPENQLARVSIQANDKTYGYWWVHDNKGWLIHDDKEQRFNKPPLLPSLWVSSYPESWPTNSKRAVLLKNIQNRYVEPPLLPFVKPKTLVKPPSLPWWKTQIVFGSKMSFVSIGCMFIVIFFMLAFIGVITDQPSPGGNGPSSYTSTTPVATVVIRPYSNCSVSRSYYYSHRR